MKYALTAILVFSVLVSGAAAQTLERGNGADPLTLDPHHVTTAAEMNIVRDLYEGLVTYNAAGELIPGAAARWTISDDLLTYTFELRDAVWSNGIRVTAVDFVRGFQRLLDPATEAPDARLFTGIVGAEAVLAGEASPDALAVRMVDIGTLVIELTEPDVTFLHKLALPAAMPLYRNTRLVRPIPRTAQPTNGAYVFAGFEPGVGVTLQRNANYHAAGNVGYQTVIYRPYERQRATVAFQAGELQISNDVPVFSLAALAEELGPTFRESTYAGSFFLATNAAGPLADPQLRRAVALSIDRIHLADGVWFAAMIPTLAFVPEGVADLPAAATAGLGPNDVEARRNEARALLNAAGFDQANPLTLILAGSDSALQQQSLEAIAADLTAIGIEVSVLVSSATEHQQRLTGIRDYDLAAVGWIARLGHVAEFLTLFEPGGISITGHTDPEFEALMAEARMTSDATVRAALFAAADRLIANDLPVIPLMHYAAFNLVSADVAGWQDNALDIHLSRWLSPAEDE